MNEEHVQMWQTVCREGDPVYLLSEGYAYCVDRDIYELNESYYLYRLTPPLAYLQKQGTGPWVPFSIYPSAEAREHKYGEREVFIRRGRFTTKQEMLQEVEQDMWRGSGQPLEAPSYAEWLATVS